MNEQTLEVRRDVPTKKLNPFFQRHKQYKPTCILPTALVSKLMPPLGNGSISIRGTDSYPWITAGSSWIFDCRVRARDCGATTAAVLPLDDWGDDRPSEDESRVDILLPLKWIRISRQKKYCPDVPPFFRRLMLKSNKGDVKTEPQSSINRNIGNCGSPTGRTIDPICTSDHKIGNSIYVAEAGT